MAAKIVKETKAISSSMAELQSQSTSATVAVAAASGDVEFARCYCCRLTEECTPAYIARVRERYQGRWICGLCAEAVKDEVFRSEKGDIGTGEAVKRHMKFCEQFRSSSPPSNPGEDLISAMKQLLRRTLDSPRKGDFASCRPLGRSKSCFATIPETTQRD